MKVRIGRKSCVGDGKCMLIAPKVFDGNDNNHVEVEQESHVDA
jgi:ferredoxin